MFSSGPNYTKLKTNLRLALNRLKLLEKKKSELTQKARKEIADYITAGKPERAKIRVEHIIREDYLVEAMEIVEMYCDLILARFGLVTQMKELDDGIAEAVYSIIWVAPRLQADVQELRIISDMLSAKYGKQFAEAARCATDGHKISDKLMHKMAIQAPSKLLVEKYLIEIAKIYNIEYEPDPQVMQDEQRDNGLNQFLIDLSDKNNLNGGMAVPQPAGFIGYPQPPTLPEMPLPPVNRPFNYPPPGGFGGGFGGGNVGFGGGNTGFGGEKTGFGGGNTGFGGEKTGFGGGNTGFGGEKTGFGGGNTGFGGGNGGFSEDTAVGGFGGNGVAAPSNYNYNIPPQPPQYLEKKDLNINTDFLKEETNSLPPAYSSLSPDDNLQNSSKPKPQPRSKIPPDMGSSKIDFPELPNVPLDFPDDGKPSNKNDDEIDFDYITKRFEELKKKK